MKKLLLFLIAVLPLFVSCSSDDEDNNGGSTFTKTDVSGIIEKGPFVQGSKVTLYDLNSNLEQTGKNYTTNTKSDLGAFDFGNSIELSSQYGELETSGYFYNECDSNLSSAPITLKAIADLSGKNKTNVNLLTHLEYARVKQLVKNGSSFADAKRQSERELLRVFAITNSIGNPEDISVTDNNDNAAILLAISSILLYNHSEAEFSELISKFSNDFENDGTISDENVLVSIKEGQEHCHPGKIVHAMKRFYSEKGSTIDIPDFSKFVDFNGDGIIDDNDKEELDTQPSVIDPSDSYSIDEDDLKSMVNAVYQSAADFTSAQLAIENLRITEKSSINSDNGMVYDCWNKGYAAISRANQLLRALGNSSNTSYDVTPYLNETKAINAYIYYNMAMLWGNIVLVKPDDSVMSMDMTQPAPSVIYNYCLELLQNLNSFENEDRHISKDFVSVLSSEIQLTLGNNSAAATLLRSVNPSYTFNFGTNAIHTQEFVSLLKEEASNKDNSSEWFNRGVKYGTWAALKRLGKAQQMLGINEYELLMPIPMPELSMNPNLKQNPGY